MVKINLACSIQFDSVVDGIGLRQVVWTQGCPHHCFGCHNPHTWAFEPRYEREVEDVVKDLLKRSYHDGVTISGGEPFAQVEAIVEIVKQIHPFFNIWIYTGYTYEQLRAFQHPMIDEILHNIDVLVDGLFVDHLKSMNNKFKGSSNQRVIDVVETLKQNEVVLFKV
ncbi:anaerobic ribonucleoside-triphosphate reductase activating protein [Erysipelotrichaceae bacterium OH741_COT-311]|nr:anaerobic ribonucleoside-triphosphate reductase activating protein [Erysipelotrichaceae bacterium]RRC92661.1 anaerobic ribonucleoside-triphosphate reductase activating protein [Erysipelotrichaceae bacterium OH741_COT-311]